jgi:DNA-binding CsgD family transcriptional regulator
MRLKLERTWCGPVCTIGTLYVDMKAECFTLEDVVRSGEKVSGKTAPKQKALMELMVAGQGTKQAAAALGMDPDTVATHLSRAKVKLGAKTRYQAIAIFTLQKVKEEI